MTTRGLYVFRHDSELGNAPAHKLFELIQANKHSEEPARDFSDYRVTVNDAGLPTGVTLQRIVG
jgi:CRISPR-associated protein Csd2